MDKIIYHITTPSQWQTAVQSAEYRADSLQTEGFIHCSFGPQVNRSLNKYYAGHASVLLLHIDTARLTSPVVTEGSGGGDKFPHIYGPINIHAVIVAQEIRADAHGTLKANIQEQ